MVAVKEQGPVLVPPGVAVLPYRWYPIRWLLLNSFKPGKKEMGSSHRTCVARVCVAIFWLDLVRET